MLLVHDMFLVDKTKEGYTLNLSAGVKPSNGAFNLKHKELFQTAVTYTTKDECKLLKTSNVTAKNPQLEFL